MTDEIKALADKWLNKVPHFMPENMSHLVGMEKQAFEAGYKAALSGTERVECYLPVSALEKPESEGWYYVGYKSEEHKKYTLYWTGEKWLNYKQLDFDYWLKKVTLLVVREDREPSKETIDPYKKCFGIDVASDNKSSNSGGDAPFDSSNSIGQGGRPCSDITEQELTDFLYEEGYCASPEYWERPRLTITDREKDTVYFAYAQRQRYFVGERNFETNGLFTIGDDPKVFTSKYNTHWFHLKQLNRLIQMGFYLPLLNIEPNPERCVATKPNSEPNPDPKSNKKEPVIDLRDKFFRECTEDVYFSFQSDAKERKVSMTPHNLFEWFKPYLKSKGEPVIDWEALDRDLCKNFFYSYTPKWVKWLKSNLPNYIK